MYNWYVLGTLFNKKNGVVARNLHFRHFSFLLLSKKKSLIKINNYLFIWMFFILNYKTFQIFPSQSKKYYKYIFFCFAKPHFKQLMEKIN